jgi:ABC-type branched-subunit amino acid transport system permease subunit
VTPIVDRARGLVGGRERERFLAPVLIVVGLLYPWYVDTLKSLPVIGDFIPSTPSMVVMVAFTMMALGLNIVVGYAGRLDLG